MANNPIQPQEPDSRLNVSFDDLKDPKQYRLNQVINHLYSKFDSLANNGKFYGTSQFQNIVINADRDLATLQNPQVLNYGELKRLGLTGGTTTTIFGGGGGGGGGSTTTRIQYAPQVPYVDSITRFIGEKVGERISVLDFGAVGDGVTDDAPAFQLAIDSAIAAGGKAIYIPACRFGLSYLLKSKLTINNALILTGTVNTSGTDVTWGSGYKFPSYIVGQTITIDSNPYTVDTWVDDENITITSTAGTSTGVTYSTPGQGFVAIAFIGDGDESLIVRGDDLNVGEGLFDVQGENILFAKFKVDGDVTTPIKLLYAAFSSDPKSALLTINTSFWIHGPSANISFEYLTITHTGGYAILLDAVNASNQYDSNSYDVNNIRVLSCNFLNNRPNLFGSTAGQENYGSWTGGIFLNTYGVQSGTNYLSTVQGVLIQGCYFEGNTGNCIWSHLYGYNQFIYDLRCLGNTFIDNGLDCIEYGGISGGACVGNRTRRTGYIATDPTLDVSINNPTIPKWLTDANATAIDTSGVCRNVSYANNTCISTNGGDFDLDGFSTGDFTGNVSMTPESGSPEYIEDSIAISGPANDGVTWSYGCQPSNTFGGDYGAIKINITGNSFINKNGGAIRLGASRNCFVSNNNIWHPPDANVAPIIMFNIGAADYQRTYDTAVLNNLIYYNPVSMVSSIQELEIGSPPHPFMAGDKNWVHGNTCIGNTYEFYKDPNSDSSTGLTISNDYPQLTVRSDTLIDRHRTVVTGTDFDYTQFSSLVAYTTTQNAILYDHSIVGVGGYVNTAGTAVTWASGDQFGTFSNGDSILINGVTYTISTVNSAISITLTGTAGTHTGVPFASFKYRQGEAMLNVGSGNTGAVTTGNRFTIGFDDVMATGVFAADNFSSFGDTTYNVQQANKYPDTFGLLRYDGAAKVFKISNSATAGVRVWTTLGGGGGSVGGSNTDVQYNDSGVFGGDANFTWTKIPKVLTITGTTATPGIVVANAYIQSAQGFLSTADSYSAVDAWIPTQNIGGGALVSGIGLGPTYFQGTVDTSGLNVTFVSGSVFSATMIGTTITINGVGYTVATVPTSTTMTLTGTAGVQTGVDYYCYTGGRGGYLDIQPLLYDNYPIGLTGVGSFGSDDVLVWVSPVNATVTPNTTHTLNTNAGINAANGFATSATANNAIQAPSGGIAGKYLIATDSLFFIEEAAPALSSAGQSRIYMDSSTHTVKISQNAGGYVDIVSGGGGSPGGSDTYVQYNDSGSFGGDPNFTWVKAAGAGTQILTVTGLTGSASIKAITSYIQSEEGFLTGSISVTAVNVTNGGVYARYLITPDSILFIEQPAPALSATGQSRLYMDSTSHAVLLSENGSAYRGLSNYWTVFGSDLINNTSTHLVFTGTTSGTVYPFAVRDTAGSPGINFYRSTSTLVSSISAGTTAALSVQDSGNLFRFIVTQTGLVWVARTSDDGSGAILQATGYFNTSTGYRSPGTATDTVNIQSGGVTAKWHIATDSVFFVEEAAPAVSSAGQSRLYMDSSSHTVKISQNGSAYANILTSSSAVVLSITGTANQVLVNGTTGSAQTGAVTLTLPQSISTGSSVSFQNITSNGILSFPLSTGSLAQGPFQRIDPSGNFLGSRFTSNASGTTFQNQSGNFTVDSSGNLSSAQVNVTGSYLRGGSTVINTSNQFVGSSVSVSGNVVAGVSVQCGSAGTYVAGGGGFFGQDATGGLVCGSHTLFFKNGILYAFT